MQRSRHATVTQNQPTGRLRKLVVGATVTGLAIGTGIVGVATPADAATAKYTLNVSTHTNRSSAHALAGRTVKGKVYVFVKPASGAKKISFYVDDPKRKHKPTHVESTAPYDLEGGDAKHPVPLVTSDLRNGNHSLTITVVPFKGKTQTFTAKFKVKNLPPKPRSFKATPGPGVVTLTWHSGKGITTGFRVYRSTHKKVPLTHPIGSVSTSQPLIFRDTTGTPRKHYYYVVTAISKGRGVASSVTLRSYAHTPQPLLPLGLTAEEKTPGHVTLTWRNNGAPATVKIYRSSTPSVSLATPHKSLVATQPTKAQPKPEQSWTDTVANGATYYYVVQGILGKRHQQTAPVGITPVAAPDGVSAQGHPGGVTVSWSVGGSGSGVTQYRIFGIDDPASVNVTSDVALGTVSGATGTFEDTTAVVGHPRHYVVQALSATGHGESSPVDATDVEVPVVTAVANDGKIRVTWDLTNSGSNTFAVYHSETSPVAITPGNKVTTSSGQTTFSDTPRTNGVTEYYVVRALYSKDPTKPTAPIYGFADTAIHATPLAAPAAFSAVVDSEGHVHLSWTLGTVPAGTTLRILRCEGQPPVNPSANDSLLATQSPSDTTYVDDGTDKVGGTDQLKTDGRAYYYLIQANDSNTANGNGHTEPLTPDGKIYSILVHPQPSTPAAVTLTDTTSTVPSFSWDAFDGHTTAVELFRSTDGSLGAKVANPLVSDTSYTDNSAVSGTEYTYTVRVEGVAYVHGNDLTDYNDSTIVITAP